MYIILIILFNFHFIRMVLFEIYLWQLKEYRLDRMLAHLSTFQGRKLLFNPLNILKWVILVLIIFYSVNILILYFLVSIYVFEVIYTFKKGLHFNKYPKLTLRTFCMIVLLIFIFLLFYIYNFEKSILNILVFDRLLSLIIGLVIFLTNFPSFIYKFTIINKAKNLLSLKKHITVIGITGSYGKTSTKEYLSQILGYRYNVLSTAGSNNTEIGVAKTIIDSLNSKVKIFIAEIGAYKKGEIISICRIIKPKLGIITGLNEQHVQLFGSIENTIKAKFELIQNTARGGSIIINIGNKYLIQMYELALKLRPDLKIFTYLASYETIEDLLTLQKYPDTTFACNIKVTQKKTYFNLIHEKDTYSLSINLVGRHNVENILSVFLTALQMKLSSKSIVSYIDKIKPITSKMEILNSRNSKGTIINDTYNSNPSGVFSAIDYISKFKGNKILVFSPLIELGKESIKIHRKISELSSKTCDTIILTNNNYYDEFFNFVKNKSKSSCKIYLSNEIGIKSLQKQICNKEDIILFSGRESEKLLKEFMN